MVVVQDRATSTPSAWVEVGAPEKDPATDTAVEEEADVVRDLTKRKDSGAVMPSPILNIGMRILTVARITSMVKFTWNLAAPTDEGKFPRGWHLMGVSTDGGTTMLGSVCGQYVEQGASWQWRVLGGKTGAIKYTEEHLAKEALEEYLRRPAQREAPQAE